DAQFLRRAKERLMGRVNGSKIVVLASHNDALLRRLCNRAILLDRGRVVFDGGVKEALSEYQRLYPKDDSQRGPADLAPTVDVPDARRKGRTGLSAKAQAWKM